MRNNRFLIIAVILIAVGLIGIFMTTWFGSDQRFAGMPPTMGMMKREQMKEMMQRMMPEMFPPGIKSEDLPDPNSRGAKLLDRFCIQCHDLPSPAMHTPEEWPLVTDRMFARMSMILGMGMMNIENPSLEERQAIVAYLKTYARK